ncbi:type II secretion system F family protein [Dechloromonas sp. A34]|uniref:type II secretion system F family protein n=1 Tax=Dechloromonas sp. A34 TaxID=447588 RepID=UPI0022493046|nr:type II secretion system F family protein [Dechloromonas sp. A34]
MHWLLTVAILLAGAGLAMFYVLRQQGRQDSRRRFDEVLARRDDASWLTAASPEKGDRYGAGLLHSITQRQSAGLDLRRAGWTGQNANLIYVALATIAPVVGMLLSSGWGIAANYQTNDVLALAFLGFGAGYLLPPRLLRWQAGRRQKLLREEMVAVLHVLRMLFDAGLSLEHALRIFSEQGNELAPEMASEIGLALARINSGQDRADALEEMAAPLGVPELDDTVAILKQATRYGGSLRESLVRFATLMEERQMTSMREYVSKLSAKMTLVMVIFMFPALMLFLAGPGFLALARALTRIN